MIAMYVCMVLHGHRCVHHVACVCVCVCVCECVCVHVVT